MPIFGCALYCKFGAIYNAHPLVDPMWSVVPVIYNAFTAPHIQTSIFIWTYLRCYCRYLENATRDILQTWCQIQRTPSSWPYVNCGPGHIQCIYSSAYSGRNIQLNVSALLLEIWRQFNAGCTTNFAPNTAHILQFTVCELWPRLFTMHLQLRIFRLQYSTERICGAIGDISTIEWALNSKHGAKYSAHPPAFAMWTVVPHIYKVFTAPHIHTSIFIWSNLRCNWGHPDN
jgi:hypothetical protein